MIRTTHTGSLPRPDEILEPLRRLARGEAIDQVAYDQLLARHVAEVVDRQVQAGISIVTDGEASKPSFMQYLVERLGGFESRVPPGGLRVPTGATGIGGRDATMFPDFYERVLENNPFADVIRMPPQVCVRPITYRGQAQLRRDIANLKAAMAASGATQGFMPSASPVPSQRNEYYGSEREFIEAFGEAMREEYRAILDAGLYLEIDFPRLVSSWDDRRHETVADYRQWAEAMIEHVNHALRGLPQERIRFHTCYGVNVAPRVSDLELEQVIDLLFRINAGAYLFEAANPRHEHEWRVFLKRRLPAGKTLVPGVVTHASVLVEHPQVVADRMERWIKVVGMDNLMFGNDCGFQSMAGNREIPITVAWAKLQALGAGARIADTA
jgi:5-methyltetrahydropteroyltriglutamate--homocysteine methyltransferase